MLLRLFLMVPSGAPPSFRLVIFHILIFLVTHGARSRHILMKTAEANLRSILYSGKNQNVIWKKLENFKS